MLLSLFAIAFSSNAQNRKSAQDVNSSRDTLLESRYSYKVISSINNTWGYDIFNGNKKIIHQQSIPGMPGNEGFKNRPYAEKVAELVINKLEKGEMPPSISKEELENLKVL